MSTEPSGLRTAPTSAGPVFRSAEAADEPAPTTLGPAAGAPTAPGERRRRREAAPDTAPRPSRRPPPRRKRKARKVHRVVRHVEVWSVAKLTAAFVACGYVVAMISGYLLWRAADRVGTIDGLEGFLEDSGSYDTFVVNGSVVFRVAAVAGVVLALATVAVVVLAAVLFNLISDITGGIRMTVIDEDLIVAPARRPRPVEGAAGERGPGTTADRPPTASSG